MKVGIITHYYKNYNIGGLLQAFALCKVLNSFGVEAEQICYEPTRNKRNLKENLLNILFNIDHIFMNPLSQSIIKILNFIKKDSKYSQDQKQKIENWNNKLDNFKKKIPHSVKIFNDSNCDILNNDYDAFICGSDVIWHPGQLLHKPFYLYFANVDKIKFSYAASMGKLPRTKLEKKLLKENLRKLDDIGVREDTIKKFLKDEYSIESRVVLDPTLLLDNEEWKKIESKKVVPKKKYIFCYFLGSSTKTRSSSIEFAKNNNLPLFYISTFIEFDIKNNPLTQYGTAISEVGPEEMIALIDNAEYVLTDSFHGVIFSTIFKKKFYVFDRNNSYDKNSINSRIDDFLLNYNLQNHKVKYKNNKISFEKYCNNYTNIEKKIKKDIALSKKYILMNLKIYKHY